jgi:hypothetical protein
MIDDDDDDRYDEAIQSISVIDKINILISLVEKNNHERQSAFLNLLEEAKFHLFHAWNEAQYYRELCEAYENAINKAAVK